MGAPAAKSEPVPQFTARARVRPKAQLILPDEIVPGEPHVIWRRIGTHAIFTPPPGP